jgi:hypothetical protein
MHVGTQCPFTGVTLAKSENDQELVSLSMMVDVFRASGAGFGLGDNPHSPSVSQVHSFMSKQDGS